MKKVLLTGAAGFIGFHFAKRLLEQGVEVFGADNLNSYYDPALKRARLEVLRQSECFHFERLDLADERALEEMFRSSKPDLVVHLAAQAGVRYSLENPRAYVDSNLIGFVNVLEACRHHPVEHLVFASSSSVYGANTKMPFSVQDSVDHPISLYGATKKSNEMLAHSYSHLFGIPTTGLRFFTVYGPWGRPDMAVYKFTQSIDQGRPIDVYNHGRSRRDFTYIDDIVDGMLLVANSPAEPDPAWSGEVPDPGSSTAPYRIYNIGNNRPEEVLELIRLLEKNLGRSADLNMLPMQPGDVEATYADIDGLSRDFGFEPKVSLAEGVSRFVDWYREHQEFASTPAQESGVTT